MLGRLTCALHARSLGGGDATSTRKTLNDLGHPGRRVTDLLLVLNVAMFGLQSYYNPGIIMWGAKVTSPCALVHAGVVYVCGWEAAYFIAAKFAPPEA